MQTPTCAPQSTTISVKISYHPSPGEECPMTFQIGIRCSDGVILASDRKMTRIVGIRTGHKSPKIEVFEDEGIAFCSAGDDFCDVFSSTVREEMRQSGFAGKTFIALKQSLMQCVGKAREKERENRKKEIERTGREQSTSVGGNTLIVFRDENAIQLWTVDTLREFPNPQPLDVNSRVICGDSGSAAVFFPNRYFDAIVPSVEALIPLAVHTVLMAKSEFVDGLEVGIFTQSRFGVLGEKELQRAVDTSGKIDSCVADALGADRSKLGG